jgi:hypothetical protein
VILTPPLSERVRPFLAGAADGNFSSLSVVVQPCCDCSSLGADTLGSRDRKAFPTRTQRFCSLNPARFLTVKNEIAFTNGVGYSLDSNFNSTDIFPDYTPFADNSTWMAMNLMLHNTFQSLYHLVRLELGVILENQIYASPQMYNASVSDVHLIDPFGAYGAANFSRRSTSNATLMAEWAATVHSFNTSDRVPGMLYARTVPRLKPLGSAITSVFVSTFAMLSLMWTTFNIIAAASAGRSLGNFTCCILALILV